MSGRGGAGRARGRGPGFEPTVKRVLFDTSTDTDQEPAAQKLHPYFTTGRGDAVARRPDVVAGRGRSAPSRGRSVPVRDQSTTGSGQSAGRGQIMRGRGQSSTGTVRSDDDATPKKAYKLMRDSLMMKGPRIITERQAADIVDFVSRDSGSQSPNVQAPNSSSSTSNTPTPAQSSGPNICNEPLLPYTAHISDLVDEALGQSDRNLDSDAQVFFDEGQDVIDEGLAGDDHDDNLHHARNQSHSSTGELDILEEGSPQLFSPNYPHDDELGSYEGCSDDDRDRDYAPSEHHDDAWSDDSEPQRLHHHTVRPSESRGSSGRLFEMRQQPQPEPAAESTLSQTVGPQPEPAAESTLSQTVGPETGKAAKKSNKRAPVWEYFTLDERDPHIAICKVCGHKVRRGKDLSKVGTGGQLSHLKKHNREYKLVQEAMGKRPHTLPRPSHSDSDIVTPPSCLHSATQSGSRGSGHMSATSTPQSSSVALSTQPLITDSIRSTKPLPSYHSRIRRLNGLLSQAMVQQLLPYSLVEEGTAVRQLLRFGIPEWQIPSRHFFARTAIPDLYRHTVNNVTLSLDYSVGNRVHLTMDCWTSNHGQGRYMSFTAHWVTLQCQQEGSSPEAASELVAPPRGVKGNSSTLPSTHAATATAEPPSKRARGTGHSRVVHRRCQAVLELVSCGEQRLNAANVLAIVNGQVQKWLTPRRLQAGHVVCDNASNLLAALNQGNIPHVPCFAHILNLVVQRFLRTYPGLSDVVQHARKVVAKFRHSTNAKALLSELQEKHGLPPHMLIADSATRWNSTLRMLGRLWEQKKAVTEFLRGGHGIQGTLARFTTEEWRVMQQVCRVLAPFDQATTFVSGAQVSISEVLPLVYMMDETLSSLMSAGEDALDELEQQSLLQATQTQAHEEEEEEVHARRDFLEVPDHCEEGEQASAASLVHGWEDILRQDEQQQQSEDSEVLSRRDDLEAQAQLFPMAVHMLKCFRRDPRIKDIKERDDYWLSALLDPRCKGKLGQFIPASRQEERMRQLQQALVRNLKEAFPQSEIPAIATHRSQQVAAPSLPTLPGDLFGALRQFYCSKRPTVTTPTVEGSYEQRLSRMVSDYMGSLGASDSMRTEDPMEFWTARLETSPELAQYALQLLACPASSVISERAFSAAGGVVTEKRSCLSKDSVNRLTFLKMNQSWIDAEYSAPALRDRD